MITQHIINSKMHAPQNKIALSNTEDYSGLQMKVNRRTHFFINSFHDGKPLSSKTKLLWYDHVH